MRLIDFESARQICRGIDPGTFCDWIDDALHRKSEFVMPVKSRINQEDGDYYAVMPCMHEAENVAMVKMIGRHQIRPGGGDRSTMMSDALVYEADSGVLKALVDGEYVTTLRTGAAAAHSVLMYGREGFSTIGLIGLGNIMTVCVDVLLAKLGHRHVTLKLYRHHGQEERLANRIAGYDNVRIEFCDSYEATIKGSDIVISAVTRTTQNFCDDSCYGEGVTVIPIMTMGFQNCDLFFDKVFADEVDQIRGFKYFNSFKSVANHDDVMRGVAPGRESQSERILVYNYGLAVHDLYFIERLLELDKSGKEVDWRYCRERFFV